MSTAHLPRPQRLTERGSGAVSAILFSPQSGLSCRSTLFPYTTLFRIFDIIWALTAGGPGTMTETVSVYAYVQGFQQFESSYTAAIAFLVIALLTVIVTWAIRRMGLAK